MGHILTRKTEGNRRKMIYYAPPDVRAFVKAQAKARYLSQSEIVVQIIQGSWDYKRKASHGRL